MKGIGLIGAAPEGSVHGLALRRRFRFLGRQILLMPLDPEMHRRRIDVALVMEGIEPLQGAIADLFEGCDKAAAQLLWANQRTVLRGRLGEALCQRIDHIASTGVRPKISALATSWSVLCTPALAGFEGLDIQSSEDKSSGVG